MAKRGRKNLDEEMEIKRRYCELTEPFFKVIKEFLKSKVKSDRQWAAEQLSKGFVKMIPQLIGGDKENPIVIEGVNIIVRK